MLYTLLLGIKTGGTIYIMTLPLDAQLHNFSLEAHREVENAVHELNRERRETSRELSAVYKHTLETLDVEALPPILELTIGEKKYVSIRRLESTGLNVEEAHSDEGAFESKIRLQVPAKYIIEDSIGILITPSTLGALPVTEELQEFLAAFEGIDFIDDYGGLLPHALASNRPFNSNEWDVRAKDIAIIKNVGGKYYKLGRYLKWDKNIRDDVYMAVAVKPDEKGNLSMTEQGYWWSDVEMDAQSELNASMARFYVLVEGSSDKQTKKKEVPQATLEPAHDRVVIS